MKKILLVFVCVSFAGSYLLGQSIKKADKLFELYEYEEAIKAYYSVLGKEPDNVDALANLAECYRMINQMYEAEQWYEKAIDKKGVNPVHLLNYAKVEMALGNYQKARQFFLIYGEAYPAFGNHFAEACDFALAEEGKSTPYEVTAEPLNSVFSDFGPAFFRGRVVFSSARNDIPLSEKVKNRIKLKEGIDNQLFLTSGYADKYLAGIQFYSSEGQHGKNIGPVSFSEDGKWVAFTNNNFRNGIRQIQAAGIEMSIYIAPVFPDGSWGDAKAFPYNGSNYSTGYPCLTNNGNTLYFASDRPESYGGFDIFVSKRVGDSWEPPVNLGSTINSQGHEISPYFDGRDFFFASDWHYGLGGMDIFMAESLGNTFTGVRNLGDGVNSPRDDYGLIYDQEANVGFMISNRPGGKGQEDIYRFNKKTDYVEINVFDATTRSPIPEAIVDFSACGEPVFKTDANGRYEFRAYSGLDCRISVGKTGYASYSVDVKTIGNKDSKSFDIFLVKEEERFIGRVIDETTNRALRDVTVKATNQENGNQVETTTNDAGEYLLPIKPANNYLIRFSKAGYLEIMKTVYIENIKDKTALGTLALQPSGTGVKDEPKVTLPEPDKDPNGEFVVPVGSGDDRPYLGDISEGYSVQVAAVFDKKENIDMTKYQKLRSVGNVYSIPEDKAIKIRVGIYSSQSQAEEARKDIQAKGFKQAFLVTETVDSKEERILLETSGGETFVQKQPGSLNSDTDFGFNQGYKIQLGAFRNPQNFDTSKLRGIGIVEESKKGNLTVFRLGGFESRREADQALREVHRKGYKDAYMVLEENGKVTRVK